jgi:sugar lactone lactonase YvrE
MLMSGAALTHAADSTRVIVPDQGNNRVLIYNHPTKSGQRADNVLGQSDFTTATEGTSSSVMSGPSAFVVDAAGNLYVSDTGNCRVLQFLQPFTNGEVANIVIGKPDFDTSCASSGASQTNIGSPSGLAIDKSGALWVADSSNARVLRFPAPLSTGETADLVIGQPDFLSFGCSTTSASNLCQPQGVAFGTDKMLWVSDSSSSRVLGYKPHFSNGMNATVELGHPAATAFTADASNDGRPSASSLAAPVGIAVDPANRLWVVDGSNNRYCGLALNTRTAKPPPWCLANPTSYRMLRTRAERRVP